jgi:hypothetical protein
MEQQPKLVGDHLALLEESRAIGVRLAERWSSMPGSAIRGFSRHKTVDFLKGIPEDKEHLRATLAILLENSMKWLRGLDETTRLVHVGSFEKFVFPLIRAVFANLVANELVTVQPLTAPTGLVFYLDVLYGTQKGRIARGSRMFDVRAGAPADTHYTDEVVEEEAVGTGDGVTAGSTGALAHIPVRAGTVKFTDGTQEVVDNGNGALVGNVNPGGVNTINYANGVYNGTFANAPAAGAAITCSYEYNMEANTDIPEVDLLLTSSPVTARPRKLRARWSIEAQQDFEAYHGINAEVEVTAFMANEIQKEVNYQIVRHIQQIAGAGTVTWDRTPPVNVPWIWHKESLYDAFVQGSNLIFQATQRRSATWVVAGIGVCDIIETLSKFKSAGAGAAASVVGIRRIGELGDLAVFKDPAMARNTFLMGFKGSSFLDTGYIYAPYLALYVTPTIVLDDMISRKGMMQRTGLKVVNANMYCTGTVTQTGGAFGP